MAHHHHDGDDAYHVDQLCMVGLSAAFGGICLGLYFWKQEMLSFMLAPKLQIFLVISGAVLLLLAVLRALSLWMQPAKASHNGDHVHGEAGCCDHDHDHDHSHAHEHEHSHNHAHAHAHDHSDHDHGWAPWRYMVLLFPIILFLLGLPNKGPQVQAYGATGLSTANQSQLLNEWSNDNTVRTKDYSTIVRWAHSSAARNQFRGKLVEVRGQYAPASATEFRLVRFRIACCGADATPLDVPIISSEKIEDWAPNAWIEVRGRVDFEQLSNGKTMTVIRIPGPTTIQKCPPQPYLQ